MQKNLIGHKVAILVANGFLEDDLAAVQRGLQKAGATTRLVSLESGLVNSWKDDGWGLHFAADAALNMALAADYDMLVLPGGMRSANKLKLTQHTKRFIDGFMNAGKPIAAFGDGMDLLIFGNQISGYKVAGCPRYQDMATGAGASWDCDAPWMIDNNLFTCCGENENRDDYVGVVVDHFASYTIMEDAA